MPIVVPRTVLATLALLIPLSACGDSDAPSGNERAKPMSSAETRAAIEDKVEKATGPAYLLGEPPHPCRFLTAGRAQTALDVREVVADPGINQSGAARRSCAFEAADAPEKRISIRIANLPYMFFNSGMSPAELTVMLDQQFPAGAAFAPADSGPGAQRFVAKSEDSASYFVMSGVGVCGNADLAGAEAAFVVTIEDPSRPPGALLAEARTVADAFASELINAARKR